MTVKTSKTRFIAEDAIVQASSSRRARYRVKTGMNAAEREPMTNSWNRESGITKAA